MIRGHADIDSTARITAAYRDLVQVLVGVTQGLAEESPAEADLRVCDLRLRDLSRELETLLNLDDESSPSDASTNRRVAAIEREIATAAQTVRALLQANQTRSRPAGLER